MKQEFAMSLFTKKIGPIFLKESSSAEKYIDKLQTLSTKAKGNMKDEIENQIAIMKYGRIGEDNIAFELRNSGYDMYILHDIYLEYENLSAQIDYLVITRKRVYILECKNLIGNIEVNSAGDFVRTYELFGKKIKEGIYSPITQNIRHLNVIKEIGIASRGNIISKKIFENSFGENYKSVVVLANPKTILNAKFAKKEIKEQIVRADQLINKIKELDAQVKDVEFNEKTMLEIANSFLAKDKAERSDYAKKYEELIAQMEINTNIEQCQEEEEEISNIPNKKQELVSKLKAFRLEQSRVEKIKPYYIFNDVQDIKQITKVFINGDEYDVEHLQK